MGAILTVSSEGSVKGFQNKQPDVMHEHTSSLYVDSHGLRIRLPLIHTCYSSDGILSIVQSDQLSKSIARPVLFHSPRHASHRFAAIDAIFSYSKWLNL
jgi:hypothetical protein